jgi:hypothetical protein
MNAALVGEIETMFRKPAAPAKLKCAGPLTVACRMLSGAAAHQMTATTVVGALGCDDVDAFRSLVTDISEEYGLDATVKLQVGAYSVRFCRRSFDDAWR